MGSIKEFSLNRNFIIIILIYAVKITTRMSDPYIFKTENRVRDVIFYNYNKYISTKIKLGNKRATLN